MEIKQTTQGVLIYITMTFYLRAFFVSLLAWLIAVIRRRLLGSQQKSIFILKGLLGPVVCLILVLGSPFFIIVSLLTGLIALIQRWPVDRFLAQFERIMVWLGHGLYLVGFVLAVVSWGYRWYDVGHVPLQNLFEVFLFLGMIYPVSLFCRRFLRVGGFAADMLIGAIVLFPAGFVFHAEPQRLPPALQSWLFTPHVAVYMFSYIFIAKATFQAICQLAGKNPKPGENLLPPEQAAYRIVCVGFPLLTLGLILGSYWGKLAWGDYWGWDPKELWSLVSWLVFVGYFHHRYMFGRKYPKLNSLWIITGMAAIIITLLWVNLSRLFPGLHSYAT